MKCMNCGKEFDAKTVVQKYCSSACKQRYYRKHGSPVYSSITFQCAQCGRTVVTDGSKDKRTRFCCESCERKYWKHPPGESASPLTNYHSISDYESWERRTNE